MGTVTIGPLSDDRRALLPDQKAAITAAGNHGPATTYKFTFLAAFDGTNNNKDNLPPSGFQTNAANIFTQAKVASIEGQYYRGVGTGGEMGGFIAAGVAPSGPVRVAAEKAYSDFVRAASDFLSRPENAGATAADLSAAVVTVAAVALLALCLPKWLTTGAWWIAAAL